MMQYTTQQGAQGICPPGWHLPTDEEWKVLEGAVDSQHGIGDPEWDSGSCGFDAGTNLKASSGWNNNGNGTDLFGFSGLPGGECYYGGGYYSVGDFGSWWTSTAGTYFAWHHLLDSTFPGVIRGYFYKQAGWSIRCLRDY